jgi:hypothetical protein
MESGIAGVSCKLCLRRQQEGIPDFFALNRLLMAVLLTEMVALVYS